MPPNDPPTGYVIDDYFFRKSIKLERWKGIMIQLGLVNRYT